MRKGKTVIKRIEEKIKRQVTFAKRKKSLLKKAHELSVLCDVHLGLIIFSHSNRLYDFCSNSTSMENVIMRYQKEKEGQTTAEHSFHPDQCSNCVKTKESMTREIENLKMNLQLYDGHGLNLLTYDELLCFELHLESSLQHVRARKFEFMHQQQQQTDQKLKGKEKGQGSSWEQLMWQAERQMMMTCQSQEDPATASEEGVPFLRWGSTHRRSSPPLAATTRPNYRPITSLYL
ncbi:Transcription factor K-box [Arabidopsis thaliana x Arabidopsis arenosa]|uniref:Transcription factor K-box n=1 Tax=Arabidopsis thaliana x Arabidopsis arenosa TaxID=1240361 RepID=A0A8T2CE29_9BRAS|nr:Transcription factor K-box [Arabidopsis thaliana x Arabidopsis arenosa]